MYLRAEASSNSSFFGTYGVSTPVALLARCICTLPNHQPTRVPVCTLDGLCCPWREIPCKSVLQNSLCPILLYGPTTCFLDRVRIDVLGGGMQGSAFNKFPDGKL